MNKTHKCRVEPFPAKREYVTQKQGWVEGCILSVSLAVW